MPRYQSREWSLTKQSWYAMISTVETALFIGIQAVMVVSVVLVAARALTAA